MDWEGRFVDHVAKFGTRWLLLEDHTHLSKIYEIYWEHEYVYIIEEYYPMGQFIKGYSCNGNNLENHVALIMKSLLSAICYLHSFGIVHGY